MNVKDNLVSVDVLNTTLFSRQKPARSKRNIFDIWHFRRDELSPTFMREEFQKLWQHEFNYGPKSR